MIFEGLLISGLTVIFVTDSSMAHSTEMTHDLKPLNAGFPQSSMFGPRLFLLYVNNIANVCSVLFVILFANDPNVFVQGKYINEMFSTVNGEWITETHRMKCINNS